VTASRLRRIADQSSQYNNDPSSRAGISGAGVAQSAKRQKVLRQRMKEDDNATPSLGEHEGQAM
jgi:hypothetical protein